MVSGFLFIQVVRGKDFPRRETFADRTAHAHEILPPGNFSMGADKRASFFGLLPAGRFPAEKTNH
jgi:hypothetical protein